MNESSSSVSVPVSVSVAESVGLEGGEGLDGEREGEEGRGD